MKNSIIRSIFTLVLTFMALPMMGQDWMEINFKDGTYRKFYLKYVTEITTSKYDAEGVLHSDYEYQRIVTKDDVFVYQISDVESISFTKYNDEVADDNYLKAMNGVFNLLGQNSESMNILNSLDEINNNEAVDRSWSDGHELFVKIKGFGTVSFHFSHGIFIPEQDLENAKVYHSRLLPLIRSAMGKQLADGKQLSVVLANQTHNDQTFSYDRDMYFAPLKKCFENSGMKYKYLISPTVDFFYDNSSDPENPHLYDADIVLLDTHGCYDANTGVHSILTGEILGVIDPNTNPSEIELNEVRNKLNQLREKYGLKENDIDFEWSEEFDGNAIRWIAYPKLTEDFFKYRAQGEFKNSNSILFNCACKSLKGKEMHTTYGSFDQVPANYSFADALLDRKLGTYLGYNESNSIGPYASSQTFTNMLNGYSLDVACYYLPDQAKAQIRNITIGDDDSSPIAYLMRVPDISDSDYGSIFFFQTYTEKVDRDVVNNEYAQNKTVTLEGITTHYNEKVKGLQYGFKYSAIEQGQNPAEIIWENEPNIEAVLKTNTSDGSIGNRVFTGVLFDPEPGKTYYYCAYTYDGMNYNYGEPCSFTIEQGSDIPSYTSCPDDHHPHLIDLGLPSGTKWACCNVGASKPEDYGGYYAWGETEEKDSYSCYSYTLRVGGSYETYRNIGSNIAGTEYDVAKVKWGEAWAMPNYDQIKELFDNCSSEWVIQNGVGGRCFTGSNGYKLFFPAAGNYSYELLHTGYYGYYWSSSLSGGNNAYSLFICSSGEIDWRSPSRDSGHSVRPVKVEAAPEYPDLQLSETHIIVVKGSSATVEITAGSGEYGVTNLNSSIARGTLQGTTVTIDGVAVGNDAKIVVTDMQTGQQIIITVTVTGSSGSFDANGHEYVDLGLPSGTKWATCNVGASKPEENGGFYAWGETEEKTSFYEKDYKYYEADNVVNIYYDIAGSQYDVAHVKWGGEWVIPSQEQIKEMLDNCSFEKMTINGVNGQKYTSKINGNSIFLPAMGYRRGDNLLGSGTVGYYWSATRNTTHTYIADVLFFYGNQSPYMSTYTRFDGANVRPVIGGIQPLAVSSKSLYILVDDTKTVTITRGNGNYNVTSNDVNVATASLSGSTITVKGVSEGTTTITVTDTQTQRIATINISIYQDNINGYGYVDLGLPSGTKWATCNVGASKPEEYGGYYAWGETEEKDNSGWETYKWCNGSQNSQTKYCTKSGYGTVDNKTVLEPEDDIAHVKWGGSWRMPTLDECQELIDNCTPEWTSLNGVKGCKLTSMTNGKSIFFPTGGWGGDNYFLGSFGFFWSSTLSDGRQYFSYNLSFDNDSNNLTIEEGYRSSRESVRPVSR